LSKERLKLQCGCEGVLVQCYLAGWINEIQEYLELDLQTGKELVLPKYWAHTNDPDCQNKNHLYERSQVF